MTSSCSTYPLGRPAFPLGVSECLCLFCWNLPLSHILCQVWYCIVMLSHESHIHIKDVTPGWKILTLFSKDPPSAQVSRYLPSSCVVDSMLRIPLLPSCLL
jgi:hypothetical protein